MGGVHESPDLGVVHDSLDVGGVHKSPIYGGMGDGSTKHKLLVLTVLLAWSPTKN